MPPEICFRQFYLPPIQNPEYQSTLCTMQAECEGLMAEGWVNSNQLALQSGREVLFTFTRTCGYSEEELESMIARGGDTKIPIVEMLTEQEERIWFGTNPQDVDIADYPPKLAALREQLEPRRSPGRPRKQAEQESESNPDGV